MNVDNIRQIARDILDHKDDFNMNTGFHSCGTPACLAGFCAVRLKISKDEYYTTEKNPREFINDYFNIPSKITSSNSLFAPDNEYGSWGVLKGNKGFITPEHAASVLYYLADTGEIDWSVKGYFPVEASIEEKEELVPVRINETTQSLHRL